jgi:hypothetical protein
MVACMVVMPVPEKRWTDEKLDQAFGRLDGELRELRMEIRNGFEQIDMRFEQMDKRFERVENRLDSMQRNMFIVFVTINATFIGGLLAIHP